MATSLRFDRRSHDQHVIFGVGTFRRRLAEELERHAARRVLVVAGPHGRTLLGELAGGLPVAGHVDEVRRHVPVEVAEKARARASELGADLLLSIGGGAATGTAKAVALTTGLPILAIPTTYAGSEATPVWGLTENGRKSTGTAGHVLPRTVLYDPDLTTGLPAPLSVASGLNALAHCVDALWAPRADPVSTALALEGARALATGLPLVHDDPSGTRGRELCLYGAYLAGLALAGAGAGLHHRICHALGGAYDLPHAETHAAVLPHVLSFNIPAAPEAGARLAVALGGPEPIAALGALYDAVDAPRSLRALGLAEDALSGAAIMLSEVAPPDNPRPFGPTDAEHLLSGAWAGSDPACPGVPPSPSASPTRPPW